jgi:hypothetical protein
MSFVALKQGEQSFRMPSKRSSQFVNFWIRHEGSKSFRAHLQNANERKQMLIGAPTCLPTHQQVL